MMINVIIMIIILVLNTKIAKAIVFFLAAVTDGVMIVSMDHPAVLFSVNDFQTFNGFNWCRNDIQEGRVHDMSTVQDILLSHI